MAKQHSGARVLLSFRPFLLPYKKQIATWFLIYGTYYLMGIGTPLAIKFYLDDVLAKPGVVATLAASQPAGVQAVFARIWLFAGLYAFYMLLMHLFYLFGYPMMHRSIESVVAGLRFAVYEKLHRLSIRYFDRTLSGEVVNQVLSDTRQLLNLIGGELVQVLLQTCSGVLCLGVLLWWNRDLGLVVLAFLPVYAWLFFKFLPLIRKSSALWRRAEDKLWGNWGEKLRGMHIVQAFARERGEALQHHRYGRESAQTWYRMSFFGAQMNVWGGLTAQVSQHFAFALGCVLVINRSLSVGELFSLAGLITYVLAPVQGVFNVVNIWQQSTVSGERIRNILQEVEEVAAHETRRRVGRLKGAVDFVHVHFEYEKERPVLRDVHFSLAQGETVALVGHTGCGKTTVVSLIQGFYLPQRGSVLIDGIPTQELLPQDLRTNIGVVPQDVVLFQDTLRANIAYGRPQASQEEILRVAEAAQLGAYVRSLPQGLDTRFGGEEGINPSKGEAQRIAIARALLIDPCIVILDEATSALDSREEEELQKAVKALLKNRTAMIIAHRLSTIRQCDRVFVFERGEIIESGAPGALLASPESAYSKLHRAHFSGALHG